MFKLFASFMILISSTLLGFLRAADFEKREKILKRLKYDLDFIKNEITFMRTPVEGIIKKLSETEGELKIFYKTVYDEIRKNADTSVSQIWLCKTEETLKLMPITKGDADVLRLLGQSFGKSDTDGQSAVINTAAENLNLQLCNAVSEKEKNSHLFKSLGFYAGILIVVMFF